MSWRQWHIYKHAGVVCAVTLPEAHEIMAENTACAARFGKGTTVHILVANYSDSPFEILDPISNFF